jgi:hypothetical protein
VIRGATEILQYGHEAPGRRAAGTPAPRTAPAVARHDTVTDGGR